MLEKVIKGFATALFLIAIVAIATAMAGKPEDNLDNTQLRSQPEGLYSEYVHNQYDMVKRMPQDERTSGQQAMVLNYEANYANLRHISDSGGELDSSLRNDLRRYEERAAEYEPEELPKGF